MRLIPLLTAAVLVAAPVAATALPASAATCTTPTTTTQVAHRTVVVDTAGANGFDVLVAVQNNGCAIGAVTALVTSPTRTSTQLALTAQSGDATTTLYAGHVDLSAATLADADAGTWKVRTSTSWGSDAAAPVVTEQELGEDEPGEDEADEQEAVEGSGKVSVLADADLSADATSGALKKGKISKGKALVVKGTLSRARWEAGTSTGYAKQRVEVQFRTPNGTYKKVKNVTTKSGGSYSASLKAVKDGCYRVVFGGSKTVAPVNSAGECIDVR